MKSNYRGIVFGAIWGTGMIDGQKIMVVKPQTYMNLSGNAVQEIMNFYKIETKDLLVIYDDMDVEKGMIKIRKQGGPGSHNGMKSVIHCIGKQDFARIRVGIGQNLYDDKVDYVIGPMSENQYDELKPGIEKAADAIEAILKNGIDYAMNHFN